MVEQDILERARELSQVTPEERAELAERQRANRLDSIMSAPVQKGAPAMIRKVNENGLQGPETEEQLVERMKHYGGELTVAILKQARSENTTHGQLRSAVARLVAEIMLVSIANQKKRAELERRIEALEKELKPRHRVKAITERIEQ